MGQGFPTGRESGSRRPVPLFPAAGNTRPDDREQRTVLPNVGGTTTFRLAFKLG
ncbi:hypothetical protein HMPREF9141_1903 [Prevotella multiformis DSM 16608]|uniref:Uncharacterized protein n=1 Tax=Prevotella multiformis DSM 16608 TaxID=888743 RepID=F0F8I6_9BACT|nr:hypothetical protein HMPREF9141_1903 [Prevotella multiformis DSM 16608]